MKRALMFAVLGCVLTGVGCASTPEPGPAAPPKPARVELPADTYVLVPHRGGMLCTQPVEDASCVVGPADAPERRVDLYRASATVGDMVELVSAVDTPKDRERCASAASVSRMVDMLLYTPRDRLQPALTAPTALTFDDGTSIRLAPGVPVAREGDALRLLNRDWPFLIPATAEVGTMFALGEKTPRGPWKGKPRLQSFTFVDGEVVVGGKAVPREIHQPPAGYVSDEEAAAQRKEVDAQRAALLARPDEELTPKERKRKGALKTMERLGLNAPPPPGIGVQARDVVYQIEDAAEGRVLVDLASRCVAVTALVPRHGLTRHARPDVLGIGGLLGTKDIWGYVPSGTPVFFDDGRAAGTTRQEITLIAARRPEASGGLMCFDQTLLGGGASPLRLCVDNGQVTEKSSHTRVDALKLLRGGS